MNFRSVANARHFSTRLPYIVSTVLQFESGNEFLSADDVSACAYCLRPSLDPCLRLVFSSKHLNTPLNDDFISLLKGSLLSEVSAANNCGLNFPPFCTAYAGSQNGLLRMLGDGRCLTLFEFFDEWFRPREFQLKGDAKTPFARDFDGLLELSEGVREIILSDCLLDIGIPAVKCEALFQSNRFTNRSGEYGRSPTCVLTRILTSSIRVGTLELFAHNGRHDVFSEIATYLMRVHFLCQNVYELPVKISRNIGLLFGKWQAHGFVHGRPDTGNISVHEETIDLGTGFFLNEWDSSFYPIEVDAEGKCVFRGQPLMGAEAVTRLARAFFLVFPAVDTFDCESTYWSSFFESYNETFLLKLGLKVSSLPNHDLHPLVQFTHSLLSKCKVSLQRFFNTLLENGDKFKCLFTHCEEDYGAWRTAYRDAARLAEFSPSLPLVALTKQNIDEIVCSTVDSIVHATKT